MVAFTSPHSLPYPTGPDRPCDAPDTWCDFANVVDEKMLDFNETINRTSRVVPFAKISTATATIVGQSLPLPFTTVEGDTDDMVDFSQSPYGITPQRNGYYRLEAWVSIVDDTFDRFWILQIENGSGGYVATEDRSTRKYQSIIVRARALVRVTTAPLESFKISILSYAGSISTDPVVLQGEFSAFWIGDQ